MDEKELKTSPKQRFFILLIAVLMLGSMVAGYALVIIKNGGDQSSGSDSSQISEEKLLEYEERYNAKLAEFEQATKGDYEVFSAYRSEIKAYNETSANANGIQTRDLLEGTGRELVAGDEDYLAYYVGWCADETIFDSSFDDNNNPTAFAKILDPGLGMIEGWRTAIEGMKIGGIREMTIASELAYGSSMEICGGYNKPLKFIMMAKAKEEPLASLSNELDEAYMRLQYAQYGIDYDALLGE